MSGPTGFTGYPNTIFQICMIACTWMNDQVSSASSPASTVAQTQNVFQTLRNGQQAIAAWQLVGAWATQLALLQQVQVLPMSLTTEQSNALLNRVTALQNAIVALQALLPVANPLTAISLLGSNQPAISYPGILEFYAGFSLEAIPSGFTADQTVAFALQAAEDWADIAASTLATQTTVGLTQGYDEAARTSSALSEIASTSSLLTQQSVPLVYSAHQSPLMAWNQNIALPAMLFAASSITSAPSSQLNQQCGVIRTVLGTAINAIALYLLTLRQPALGSANIAKLQAGDSLMQVAARTLGNFELWTSIASLNGLSAPWVGLPNSQPGTALLLPTSGLAPQIPGLALPTYDVNVLGVDWFFGPIKQPMLPWSGDIGLVAGPQNLKISLTRRILTVLGDLIYHTSYGSRIPPEVGSVQDSSSANLITAFGKSALLDDPRVNAVLSASTTLNANGSEVAAFEATVQPVGTDGSSGISVNAVLSP